MSGRDELIEEALHAGRYRQVVVGAAVVGVLASAIVGVLISLGDVPSPDDRSSFGLLVLPFAASMVVGNGIHKLLRSRDRDRRR